MKTKTKRPYPASFDALARIQHWGALREGIARDWGAQWLPGVYLLVYRGEVRYIGQGRFVGRRLDRYARAVFAVNRPPVKQVVEGRQAKGRGWEVAEMQTAAACILDRPFSTIRWGSQEVQQVESKAISWDEVRRWMTEDIQVYVALTDREHLDLLERSFIRMAKSHGMDLWNALEYKTRAPFEVLA